MSASLVLDRSKDVAEWCAAHIDFMGGQPFPENIAAIGFEMGGELCAGIVFSDWQPLYGTMQATFAATNARWATQRAALNACYDYAFKTCGVRKLWSVTPESNTRALRLARHLGFRPEAVLVQQFGAEDAIFSSLFADDHFRRSCLQQA